jgi:hypothetical protein
VRAPPGARRSRPRGRQRAVSRPAAALTLVALLAITAGFAALAVLSFRAIRGGFPGDSGPLVSTLRPVAVTGPEQTVFRWSTQACEPRDIPDMPARAFRDFHGKVQLLASHYVSRRAIGPQLASVVHQCPVVLSSGYQADPARFDDHDWIASPYTNDGRNVFALIHEEYHGNEHPGQCASGLYRLCWYNAITAAYSTNGGRSYRIAPKPRRLIAAGPYRYRPDDGPFGLFQPSNIIRKDGYYYVLVHAEKYRRQALGSCLLRTPDLYRPGAWRGWDGKGFSIKFADPYSARLAAADHVCVPVSPDEIAGMSESLTFNTYFGKYMLVGAAGIYNPDKGRVVWGVYYSLSDDLVRWEPRKLIKETELLWTHRCSDRNPIGTPSILDPSSRSRNFETAGRTPYLYFTRYHFSKCANTLNRDLVRVRLRFSK